MKRTNPQWAGLKREWEWEWKVEKKEEGRNVCGVRKKSAMSEFGDGAGKWPCCQNLLAMVWSEHSLTKSALLHGYDQVRIMNSKITHYIYSLSPCKCCFLEVDNVLCCEKDSDHFPIPWLDLCFLKTKRFFPFLPSFFLLSFGFLECISLSPFYNVPRHFWRRRSNCWSWIGDSRKLHPKHGHGWQLWCGR